MKRILSALVGILSLSLAHGKELRIDSLKALSQVAAESSRQIRMEPGVYQMVDYLTDEVLTGIRNRIDRSQHQPTVPMLVFRGDNNRIDLTGVTIEIDTRLYAKLTKGIAGGGYTRALIVEGQHNHLDGLTIRHTGPNLAAGGNLLSIHGKSNRIENFEVHVHASFPWGYGDLLGKGDAGHLTTKKGGGILIQGDQTILKRCKVFSRSFGHCFYIKGSDGSRLEDCYAEGSLRNTDEMLKERDGPAHKLGFRSVFKNRDGRFLITPGYTKSLSEDGFRTYGGAGSVTLVNCIAVNTRAGFEIGFEKSTDRKSLISGCIARGCERGFLIGSNTVVRRSRGDVLHGPLLHLRGGSGSDIELELIGDSPSSLVHALATVAGTNHKVHLSTQRSFEPFPQLPILLGFGMPKHGEMSSPSEPLFATNVRFISELDFAPVITSEEVVECAIDTSSRLIESHGLSIGPGSER